MRRPVRPSTFWIRALRGARPAGSLGPGGPSSNPSGRRDSRRWPRRRRSADGSNLPPCRGSQYMAGPGPSGRRPSQRPSTRLPAGGLGRRRRPPYLASKPLPGGNFTGAYDLSEGSGASRRRRRQAASRLLRDLSRRRRIWPSFHLGPSGCGARPPCRGEAGRPAPR